MKYTLILSLFLFSIQLSFTQVKPQDGPYKKYYDTGELFQEGQYLKKKRVGDWKNYHKNGQVSRLYSYKDGKRNKEYKSFYKDGTLKSKTEKIGEEHINTGYYESGKLKYERKPTSGYYKSFYESGAIKIKANYLENELVESWQKYYENGQLEWLVNYKDGYRSGAYHQFYDNGDIKLEGTNYKDKVDGVEKRYLKGKVLEWEGSYKKGVLAKTWTKYDANKNEIEKIKFKNGKATKVKFQGVIKPTKVATGVFERVPIYPGCEDLLTNSKRKKCMSKKVSEMFVNNFNKDLMSELNLPAGKHRIGLSFKIDKRGKLKDIKVKASRLELQVEAVRVIKLLPQLQPAFQRGKAVIVPFSLPIIFQVADKNARNN